MEKNFGRISRNKVEDIRVSLKEVNGTPHVELRVYARSPRRGEAPIPEMEAIVVPIQNLFDLCQILEQAHDHLLKEGLVQVPYIAQAVNLTPDDQSPLPVMGVPGASPDALRARNVPVKLPFESHLLGAPDTSPAKELPQQVTGEIRILSGRGALVWLPEQFPTTTRLAVVIRIGDLTFRGQAEVAEVAPNVKDGNYRHTLEWKSLTEQAQETLSKVVDAATQNQGRSS